MAIKSETSAAGSSGHHEATSNTFGVESFSKLGPVTAATPRAETRNLRINRIMTAGAIGKNVRALMVQFIIAAKMNVPNTHRKSRSESAVLYCRTSASVSTRKIGRAHV